MSEKQPTAKAMPKGGRKGGAMFPRINLEAAVGYAKKLVSKTHSGPQPKDVIYSGVLGGAGTSSNEKISALKQYGFVVGDTTNGFSASEEAKQLVAAPTEEIRAHYRAAVLRPKVFKALFDTFHGDAVTLAKLKQRASGLNVHPDETENCIEIYVQSAGMAELAKPEGDLYRHIADSDVNSSSPKPQAETGDAGHAEEGPDEVPPPGPDVDQRTATTDPDASTEKNVNGSGRAENAISPRAIFNVKVTLDSSLDTEKLQKQLELLKKYGAI